MAELWVWCLLWLTLWNKEWGKGQGQERASQQEMLSRRVTWLDLYFRKKANSLKGSLADGKETCALIYSLLNHLNSLSFQGNPVLFFFTPFWPSFLKPFPDLLLSAHSCTVDVPSVLWPTVLSLLPLLTCSHPLSWFYLFCIWWFLNLYLPSPRTSDTYTQHPYQPVIGHRQPLKHWMRQFPEAMRMPSWREQLEGVSSGSSMLPQRGGFWAEHHGLHYILLVSFFPLPSTSSTPTQNNH